MAVFQDDFNRADNTDMGANWTENNPSGGTGTDIVSNEAYHWGGPTNAGCCLQNAIMLGDGQYVQAVAQSRGGNPAGMCVRASYAAGKLTAYGVEISPGELRIYYYNDWNFGYLAGAPSRNLLDTWTGTFVIGDTVRMEVMGNSIKTYVNGVEVQSITDSNISGGGTTGFFRANSSGTASRSDDFETGNWPPEAGGRNPFDTGLEIAWTRNMGHP